jgi:hypothetical protein
VAHLGAPLIANIGAPLTIYFIVVKT